ncbi:MAG: glycosyltransferase family 4 protein, partial [Hyphomicrobiaceae bacterium]
MAPSKPTILQIVPQLDTGGAELTTLEITAALARAGAIALIVTEGGRMAQEVARLGGELIEMRAASKNPLQMLANARALHRLARDRDVDLIHARSRAPAWSALMACRKAGIPFVTTYHGAYGGSGRVKTLYNSVMARGDRVIANSQFTARLIRERHHTPPAVLRVIHRGVDLERFAPLPAAGADGARLASLRQRIGILPGARVVLQAARLAGWKGQRVTIAAAARLKAEHALDGVQLVLAGDAQGRDGYEGELRRAIREGELEGVVLLPGHVADMPAAYGIAQVAVVASTEPEAFGRTATEAQAMGCPVIATNIGAPPETVLAPPTASEEERTGWLVPPADAAALAKAIGEALDLN